LKGPVEQNHLGHEDMDGVVGGLERAPGGVDHQADDERRHDNEKAGDEPDHAHRIVVMETGRDLVVPHERAERGKRQTEENHQRGKGFQRNGQEPPPMTKLGLSLRGAIASR